MGKLTTHVLDTHNGRPAAAMTIELWKIDGKERHIIKTVLTNDDGRCDVPLLSDESYATGEYELVFQVGNYFRRRLDDENASPFLNRVPIRFTIFEDDAHYHVPLLVSPWAYNTYRGS